MNWKTAYLWAAAITIVAAVSAPQTISVARASGCEAGEKIDGSTADTAKKKIAAAGFLKIHELKKSCDNFWHAIAMGDGAEVRVVLTPQGKVMREGD
jgi:hypothetical protein